ncbi:histidine phosphotransferase family protein [Yoonia sp. 2307UL14-13]|uniref:histidine phosphotransferase family protein n=1 Tax=Yoonia sp. 2307UL14-13 TaxID=3126506 RepID=UPI0030A42C4F
MSRDLAALVGSRICHDLISPIGAIGNGIELLALTGGSAPAEMDLITDSVENANARIRFFRIAFGSAGEGQMVGTSEVQGILRDIAAGTRFEYDWQVAVEQPRPMVRCAFLMLLCVETALPLGGDVRITLDGDRWVITATGSRLKVDAALWETLTQPDAPFDHTAAQVQFALLPDLLAAQTRRIDLDITETAITARF